MIDINIQLDPSSLAQIGKLENAPARFNSHVMAALGRSAEAVQEEAGSVMSSSFMNPTGAVEGSLQNQVNSETEAQVWTESPYAQRLEYGFSGMTDSLGRYYPYWPDYHWAQRAADNSVGRVEDIFYEEIDLAAGGQ